MKFELTNESISHFGVMLCRIKALRDFSNVKKGDLGGFIEKEFYMFDNNDIFLQTYSIEQFHDLDDS